MNYMYANQECSSGCESGWTVYLEHSSISPEASYDQEKDGSHGRRNRVYTEAKRSKEVDEEEEVYEDLSMVSDASSGPPHLDEEQGYGGNGNKGSFCNCTVDDSLSRNSVNQKKKKKKKKRENRRPNKVQDQSSLLDDTASSPFFDNKNFNLTRSQPSMENVLEYSQGFSTTQFEVRPPYQQHYDFFQSGNQMPQHNQW